MRRRRQHAPEKHCLRPLYQISFTVNEDDVLSFVRATLASTWELELLLLLYRSANRRWSAQELVRELRASQVIVAHAVRSLKTHQLVTEFDGRFGYVRGVRATDETLGELQLLCSSKPFTVFNAIRDAQAAPLKTFSDAFRFRE